MKLPMIDGDYPLPLLLATKQSLLRVTEDPELEDARAVLQAIDGALSGDALSQVMSKGPQS